MVTRRKWCDEMYCNKKGEEKGAMVAIVLYPCGWTFNVGNSLLSFQTFPHITEILCRLAHLNSFTLFWIKFIRVIFFFRLSPLPFFFFIRFSAPRDIRPNAAEFPG